MSGEVHIITITVGALTNETVPIFKTPTDARGGGITVLSASVIQAGTPDSSLRLVTLGSGGTVVSGTITTTAIGGTTDQFINNAPKAFAIATAFVDANTWIGLKEYSVEAGSVDCRVTLNYVMGK